MLRQLYGDRDNSVWAGADVQNVGDCNACDLRYGDTVVILRFATRPKTQKLTLVAMLGGATSNVCRAEGIALEGVTGMHLAFLYQALDDLHVDRGSEDIL